MSGDRQARVVEEQRVKQERVRREMMDGTEVPPCAYSRNSEGDIDARYIIVDSPFRDGNDRCKVVVLRASCPCTAAAFLANDLSAVLNGLGDFFRTDIIWSDRMSVLGLAAAIKWARHTLDEAVYEEAMKLVRRYFKIAAKECHAVMEDFLGGMSVFKEMQIQNELVNVLYRV